MSPHPLTERIAARLAEGGREPVSQVIVEYVWEAAVAGVLATGDRLPTPRQVAIGLGVSPRVVERAYGELERRGVVATRAGEGTFVSLAPEAGEAQARRRELVEVCRLALERVEALGFDLEDLLDALSEFRTAERESSNPGG